MSFKNISKSYPMKKSLGQREIFWALKNVSFDVSPGEIVGVMGPNGAGKTTILKLASNVTEPTSGEFEVRGRVVPLIELNAGFHTELSGRENVYMNASILGLSRREIKKKFDDIVAFAGLEAFIDQPIKKYSSGMFARLGFSVAIHAEPEVLLVDEVLAVGDAEYQKKCVGKILDFKKKGAAVLFVSHSMRLIEELCSRVILLKKGEIAYAGPVQGISEQYP